MATLSSETPGLESTREQYTPTTAEVRRGFTAPAYKTNPQRDDESFSEFLSRVSVEGMQAQVASETAFDRWLAEHDRQAKADAWDEGHEGARVFYQGGPRELNPYGTDSFDQPGASS